MLRPGLLLAVFLAASTWLGSSYALPSGATVHEVQPGQRLGSIAKRYRVSVEALCEANGIRKNSIIRPGQRLVIPNQPGEESSERPAPSRASERAKPAPKSDSGAAQQPVVHTVQAGQRLGSIARRYNVSIEDVCTANNISRRSPIHPGDQLVIPVGGLRGRGSLRASTAATDSTQRQRSEASYRRVPRRRGYVKLVGYNDSWQGRVTNSRGRLAPGARQAVSRVLAGRGRLLDERLVRLIAQVSDHFGGRPLRVVSGYRSQSYFEDSRHRTGQAIDFSIPGVPNEVIRDYLRTLPRVGVGYYPNSSFVHLDVRAVSTYWVDYAGPGEAPRTQPRRAATSASPASAADEPTEAVDH